MLPDSEIWEVKNLVAQRFAQKASVSWEPESSVIPAAPPAPRGKHSKDRGYTPSAPWNKEPEAKSPSEHEDPHQDDSRREQRSVPPQATARKRGNHSGNQRRGDEHRARRDGNPSGSGDRGRARWPVYAPSCPTTPFVKIGEVGWMSLPFYNNIDTEFKFEFCRKWMWAWRHTKCVHPRSHIFLMEDAQAQIDFEILRFRRVRQSPYNGNWYQMLSDCADCCEKVRVELAFTKSQ